MLDDSSLNIKVFVNHISYINVLAGYTANASPDVASLTHSNVPTSHNIHGVHLFLMSFVNIEFPSSQFNL